MRALKHETSKLKNMRGAYFRKTIHAVNNLFDVNAFPIVHSKFQMQIAADTFYLCINARQKHFWSFLWMVYPNVFSLLMHSRFFISLVSHFSSEHRD